MREKRAPRLSAAGPICGLVLSLFVFAQPSWSQETPAVVENSPGFKSYQSYLPFENGESVNLGNGGLLVAHPSILHLPQNMGRDLRPVGFYNSKLSEIAYGLSNSLIDKPHGVLGVGWTLSFGRVFFRVHPKARTGGNYDTRAEYYYSDETGAEHKLYLAQGPFYQNFTTPYTGPVAAWYYTNDGSYLRAYYQGSTWTVYEPDGTVRTAGGTQNYSYLPPVVGSGSPNPDGSVYWSHLRDPFAQGWYVTSITDRASNTVSISYNYCDIVVNPSSPSHPYPGSIHEITDPFTAGASTRKLVFTYYGAGDFRKDLLYTITLAATYVETYDYTQATFNFTGTATVFPALASVQDPALLETRYSYGRDQGPVYWADDAHLQTIGYPTGAKSEYHYDTSDWGNFSDEVEQRILYLRAQDPLGAPGSSWDNHLTWTLKKYVPGHNYFSRATTTPVVVTDPLGTQEVHFISQPGDVTAGKELVVIRLAQGGVYDPTLGHENDSRIFRVDKYFAHDDHANGRGDTYLCFEDDGMTKVAQGNPRVRKTIEAQYDPGPGSPKWSKVTNGQGWDGFGHYRLNFVTGTPDLGPSPLSTQVVATSYDLRKDTGGSPVLYQLDRLTLSYAGGSSSAPPGLVSDIDMVDNEVDDPDPGVSTFYGYGSFKAALNLYDGANHGMPTELDAFHDVKGSFTFDYSASTTPPLLLAPTPSFGAGDVRQVLAYTSGNVTQVNTSGGDGGSSFQVNQGFSYGIQSSLYYGTSFSYYEFQKSISSTTSRVDSQQDANGLTTYYTYDGDGRTLTITLPGGENVVRFSYPSATTMGWRTCNAVKKYKGQLGAVPSLNRGDTISGLSDSDLYTITTLDDLGRPWLVDSVDPDSTWTEKATFFDPLGRPVFVSEPYAYGRAQQSYYVPGLSGSDAFWLYVPAQNYLGYGTWDSIYGGATQGSPFSGTLEAFYRTQWLIKPDGNVVGTAYNVGGYLIPNHQVTVYGIQTNTGPANAATVYTKDVLGRLLSVSPPLGATSSNTYDGLGNLAGVNLSGQTRTYTYNALGHLTEAINPESGTVTGLLYDATGNLLQYTDNGGTTITKDYDFKGRIRHVYKLGATLSQWDYDQSSSHGTYYKNRLTHTLSQRYDGTGDVDEDFTYDQFGGRLGNKHVTFTLGGGITSRAYDLTYRYEANHGLLWTESAARGTDFSKTITSSYIHGGLKTKEFADTKGVSGITYKPSGMMDVMSYTNGNTLNFTEETDMARLSNIAVMNGGSPLWSTGLYGYDGAGNITSIGPGQGLSLPDAFTYDTLLRLNTAKVNHINPISSLAFRVELGYTYDAYGNPWTRTITTSDTDLNNYMGSTEAGLFKAETNFSISCSPSTNRITTSGYGYDANGNLTADTKNTLSYDPLNRLWQASVNSTVNSEQYYYDAGGERDAVCRYSSSTLQSVTYYLRTGAQVLAEECFKLVGSPPDHVKAYLYVGGNLVTTEEGDVGGGSGPPAVPNGKSATTPLRATKLNTSGSSISLSFGTSCSAVTHEILYGGGSQLPASYSGTYNLSGAQCSIGASSPYTWSNSLNPAGDSKRFDWFLVVATDGANTEGSWGKNSASYERTGPGSGGSSGFCSMTGKSLTNTCGQTLTEDEQLAAEIAARDAAQDEEPLLSNEHCYYYAWDHLGSIRYIFPDGTGTLQRHDFEPQATEIRPILNTAQNTHRYTGQERDDSTSLDNFHARYLGARVARFLGADPVQTISGNPQSTNLYSYCRNNPIRLIDPTGLTFSVAGAVQWVQMFFSQLSSFIGLPVYQDDSGNVSRAQGPPAPGYAAAMEVFDRAAGPETTIDGEEWGHHFTITAIGDTPRVVIDNYAGIPGAVTPGSVSASQLNKIPSQPPTGKTDYVTRGELLAHILGEYSWGAGQGGFTRLVFPDAHQRGLMFQNLFREDLGQSRVLRQAGNPLFMRYESGKASQISFSREGSVDAIRYGAAWTSLWW